MDFDDTVLSMKNEPEPKQKGLIVLIVFAILLVIALAAGLIYYFNSDGYKIQKLQRELESADYWYNIETLEDHVYDEDQLYFEDGTITYIHEYTDYNNNIYEITQQRYWTYAVVDGNTIQIWDEYGNSMIVSIDMYHKSYFIISPSNAFGIDEYLWSYY